MPAKIIIEDINLSNFRAGFNLYVFFLVFVEIKLNECAINFVGF